MPSPFLPGTQLQYAFDSTSIGWYKECPKKYELSMLRGFTTKSEQVNLLFGIWFHSALEEYYKLREVHDEPKLSHDAALARVVYDLLCKTYYREADGHPYTGPWISDHNTKTRDTLIRSVIWYLDEFGQGDPCQTVILANGKPAVELSFQLDMGYGLVLCGHLDRLVNFAGESYVLDHKAQPLTTKILGPYGWQEIGATQIGDRVATVSGAFTTVTDLVPKGRTAVYKVHFNDKTSVLCADDHLWWVNDQFNKCWRIMTVIDMLMAPLHMKFHVPLVEPIQHAEVDLPIDPYVLGVLLGDGYLNGSTIILSTSHAKLAEEVSARLKGNDIIKKYNANNLSWGISGGNTLHAIQALGLHKKVAHEKFIPDIYKYASIEQRRQLLNGLLVTDGCWDKNHRRYDSKSLRLINDICEIVRSLGGAARYHTRADAQYFGTDERCYRISLRMPDFPTGVGKRYISRIERVEDAETMCIEVADRSGLYVTENHTVTHNTSSSTISNYYFDQFKPDNQMSLYTLAAQAIFKVPAKGVMIDAIQIAVGFSKTTRGFTYRTPQELEEWLEETRMIIKDIHRDVERDYFPHNDKSCHKYGGCPFRKVCGSDPSVREAILKSEYNVRPGTQSSPAYDLETWNEGNLYLPL